MQCACKVTITRVSRAMEQKMSMVAIISIASVHNRTVGVGRWRSGGETAQHPTAEVGGEERDKRSGWSSAA